MKTKVILGLFLGLFLSSCSCPVKKNEVTDKKLSCCDSSSYSGISANISNPDTALLELVNGNLRYTSERFSSKYKLKKERIKNANGQKPFAVILSCSDSRVPPELIFDQGIGELFVVRTAGEVVDEIGLGSIEYAVEHLGTNLIVVLGYERCGAVKATVDGGKADGFISNIVAKILPAVTKAKTMQGEVLTNAIKNNVQVVIETLFKSEIIKEKQHKGELKIVGGYYDLDDGKVSF